MNVNDVMLVVAVIVGFVVGVMTERRRKKP